MAGETIKLRDVQVGLEALFTWGIGSARVRFIEVKVGPSEVECRLELLEHYSEYSPAGSTWLHLIRSSDDLKWFTHVEGQITDIFVG